MPNSDCIANVRAALQAIVSKERPLRAFDVEPEGQYDGETRFVTAREAKRVCHEIYAEVLAVTATLPAEGCDSVAEAQSLEWPNGCIKRSSCARNRACMYGASIEQCRHFGRNIADEVEASAAAAHSSSETTHG